jgi:Na+-driven multidrug efflux pump
MFFSTFPDCYKAMLRGVIRALALQNRAVYVNITGHWMINFTSIYFICFYFGMGFVGLWWAKLILEYYVLTVYLFII